MVSDDSALTLRRRQHAAPLEGAKVLVVDDNTDACALTAIVLEIAGAEVEQANSVEAAMALLATGRFKALVSDISMPVSDGYELIRRVRAAAPSLGELPAVAVTALCTPADRARAHSAGFQEFLPKPFDASRLVETVQRLTSEAMKASRL